MNSNDNRDHWEIVHAEKQDAVSWFQERPEISLDLLQPSALPKDAAIVDIGGGASRLVDHLLLEGFQDLTVLDIADSGLERARVRLGSKAARVNWVVSDVTKWQPPRQYDVWHDRAVFHFLVASEDRAAYRQALLAGTRPGSRVVIGTFAEDGPEKCSGLPVQRYSADTLVQEIGPEFVRLDARKEGHQTPAGREQNFQFVVLKRR